MIRNITITFEEIESDNLLSPQDLELVHLARQSTINAYAPYSKFRVAAVARLNNGAILSGTNQENASYPIGICAERSLLATIGGLYPNVAVETMAISYKSLTGVDDKGVAPCGMCRQSLAEYAKRTNHSIRLLLTGQCGEILIIENADSLLPLGFSSDDLT